MNQSPMGAAVLERRHARATAEKPGNMGVGGIPHRLGDRRNGHVGFDKQPADMLDAGSRNLIAQWVSGDTLKPILQR
ncbi:MAG: hypothetical protein PHY82_12275, partial [Lentisphaeria bacterium]|nr:hypothetical protein [Lentisphaeria bacterium]